MLAQEDRDNTAAWRNKDPDGVLTMILHMRVIYTEYLNQANEANKQCNQIRTISL